MNRFILSTIVVAVGITPKLTANRYVSPKIPRLHNRRICWDLPSGTTLLMADPKAITTDNFIQFTLQGVSFGKNNRRNVVAAFSFWSKNKLAEGEPAGSDISVYERSGPRSFPDGTATRLFYAGKGDFMIVSGAHVDLPTIRVLTRLYKKIKIID